MYHLHGALCAEEYDDCEGDLLERTRSLVGPAVAIGGLFDLHAHLTKRMLEHATVLVGLKEFPHVDYAERADELFDLVVAAADRRTSPVMSLFDCRMIGSIHTTRERARTPRRRAFDLTYRKIGSAAPIDVRHRLQQRERIGMKGGSEHRFLVPDLEQVALEQHRHPVRERAHHREVVGNEQHRHLGVALQLTIEEENGEGARSRPTLRYPLPQVPPIAGVMNGAYGSGKAFRVPQSNPAGKKRPSAFAAG